MTVATAVARGLTSKEAHARLAAEGRNVVTPHQTLSVLHAIGRQLRDTTILVLIAASALTIAVGDVTDSAVILAVVVLNTTLGVVQEVRSEHALTALAELMAPRATVVRDGVERDLDAGDVVRGDLVRLAAGDIVPGDATLVHTESLQLDEAAMTGLMSSSAISGMSSTSVPTRTSRSPTDFRSTTGAPR